MNHPEKAYIHFTPERQRYDTAHRRPHKVDFYGYAEAEVLTLGERDIKANM